MLGEANPYSPVPAQAPTVPPGVLELTNGTPSRRPSERTNNALAGGETADDVATKASAEISTLMQGAGYPTQ